MVKKVVKSKIKGLDKEIKSTIEFKQWKDIKNEQGIELFTYFYTLLGVLYNTYIIYNPNNNNSNEIKKRKLPNDIKPCSVGDFIIEFFELDKDIVKSTIAINTWTLAGQDKAIVDLLCQLGKKMNMSINKATITPEELNALIDWFVNLMYEARDRLNFIQL